MLSLAILIQPRCSSFVEKKCMTMPMDLLQYSKYVSKILSSGCRSSSRRWVSFNSTILHGVICTFRSTIGSYWTTAIEDVRQARLGSSCGVWQAYSYSLWTITAGAAAAYATTIRFRSSCIFESKLLIKFSNVRFLHVCINPGATGRKEYCWVGGTGLSKNRFESGVVALDRILMKDWRITCFAIHTMALHRVEEMFDGSKGDNCPLLLTNCLARMGTRPKCQCTTLLFPGNVPQINRSINDRPRSALTTRAHSQTGYSLFQTKLWYVSRHGV